jgi:hypothetical protein
MADALLISDFGTQKAARACCAKVKSLGTAPGGNGAYFSIQQHGGSFQDRRKGKRRVLPIGWQFL